MFKNAKLLKGSTIALACALVLCLGVVFGIYYAGAAANTVTLYVSEHGDNTTGADESSAFTSIEAATTAANGMNLKPGMEVKILVVERVCLNNRYINTKVLDTAGNEVPVTVEGYGYDGDDGNLPEIYCEWYDTSNLAEYRLWVFLQGDINFRNVKFLSKLNDGYVKGYSSGLKNRLCTRYFYANGYYATFDNVVFTTEAPDTIKWTLRADSYASATSSFKRAGRSGFTLKNGDYSNCSAIGASTYPTSNLDLDISFENATIPYVTILGNTNVGESSDAALHQKAKSIKVTFGDGTIVKKNSSNCSVRLNASGYNVIPGGVTINYMEGAKFEGEVNADSVSSKVLIGDWTNNIYGGTFADVFYAGPTGTMIGKLTNNIKGGTFSNFHGTAHMGNCNAVINNISGGEFGTFYGTSLANGATSITNNITGGTFEGTFHGAGDGGRENIPDLVTNNITGGTFKGAVYLGKSNESYSGVVKKIVNNIEGVTFAKTVYGGCGGVAAVPGCDSIENKFKNCTFKAVFHGGSGAFEGEGTSGNITNNIENSTFYSWYYGGSANGVSGKITNNLTKVTVTGSNRSAMGNEYGASGDITNNLKECRFESTGTPNYYGGPLRGTAGDVINNFTDCYFAKPMSCGGGYSEAEVNQSHVANITNNIQGTTFNDVFRAGVLVGDNSGDIVTNVYEGNSFKKGVFFSNAGGNVGGNVTANILGESVFNSSVSGGGAMYKSMQSPADTITLNIKAGTFKGAVCGGATTSSNKDEDIVVNISGGTFENAVTASGKAPYNSAVLNIKPDESIVPLTFKAAVSNSTENVTTTIYGSNKPINLAKSTVIYADALAGAKNVIFCQTAQWKDGATYVSLPDSVDASRIATVNKSSGVAGTATVQTDGGRLVVVGGSGTGTVIGTVAPKLNGYSFALDNKLKVCFFIPVEQIEAYINFAGAWDYSVAMEGIEVLTGRITDISEISTSEIVNGAGDVPCFVLTTDFGIAATDFDQKITVTWSGNEDVFAKSAYELLEGGIGSASTKAEIATLLKAIYNYGIEAENVFEGKNVALKYDVTYTGTYNGAPSRTSAEDGFEFFATSLSLDGEVALNFYLKLADGVAANQMTFTAKSAAGAVLDASKIAVKAVDGVEEYDVIVSVKLSVPEMANAYTLSAALADGTVVATCTNSIANSCAGYIAAQNKFAPVSKALLAYIEKAAAAL